MADLETYSRHIAHLFDLECGVYDIRGKDFVQADHRCRRCGRCDYRSTHLYGCYEAQRWDNRYIYYCPAGYIFVAVTLLNEVHMAQTGLIAGPMQMGEPEDLTAEAGIPQFRTDKVHSFTELMHGLVSGLARENTETDCGTVLNEIYKVIEDVRIRSAYPIELESALCRAVAAKNAPEAKELLNQLLGHIFFHSNGDFETIKSRVLDLTILLSHAAIEAGANADQIFALNRGCKEEIAGIGSIDRLSLWLTDVINRFIGYVFDFSSVKHADIIHKTVDYIAGHYAQKLTLDDISGHVYMSRSYLCRVFKKEMHCSLTAYINRVRVNKSKQLLSDTQLSLIEVGNAVGFDDQSYFSKVFRSMVGVSPGRYREQYGKH